MRKELVAHQEPKSPISEIFRTLRTNIQFMNTKGRLKSILITSTLPGEGKSWVSSNLAVTFAQAGKKVVLIDADMRKGRVYSIFGVSPKPGLSNYLSGVASNTEEASNDLADYIQETEIENLYVIAAGNVPPNPSELLVSEQMINLMERLKNLCDIIIFDGTPSQLVTDSLILARIVDSTVIVTASKATKKEDLRRVIKNIKNVGGRIAGVIVNKVTIDAKKYEQSYYYGSTSFSENKMHTSKAPRKSGQEMYNRAANMMEKRDYQAKKEINNIHSSKGQNKTVKVNNPKTNTQNQNKNNINDEVPKALKKDIKIENAEEVSLDKTAEILNQINQYLDEEKKKLK